VGFRVLNFSNFQTAHCVLATLSGCYINATSCLNHIPPKLQKRNIKISHIGVSAYNDTYYK